MYVNACHFGENGTVLKEFMSSHYQTVQPGHLCHSKGMRGIIMYFSLSTEILQSGHIQT